MVPVAVISEGPGGLGARRGGAFDPMRVIDDWRQRIQCVCLKSAVENDRCA